MLTYAEFRQFADACTRWAQNTESEPERSQFLEMAAAWAELAKSARTSQDAERRSAA